MTRKIWLILLIIGIANLTTALILYYSGAATVLSVGNLGFVGIVCLSIGLWRRFRESLKGFPQK